MKYLVLILTLIMIKTSAQSASIEETITLIKKDLEGKSIQVFTEIDHSTEAEKVGLSLPKTKVLVIGNPKVGTLLMQENQEFALHLPLKILITEKNGKTIIKYEKITPLAKKYKLKKTLPIAQKIDETIGNIVAKYSKK